MSNTITYKMEDGKEIAIEVSRSSGSPRRSKRDISNKVSSSFSQSLGIIKDVGDAVIEKIKSIANKPDEVNVEIGVKFTLEAGAIIAKTSSEGAIKLSMKWTKED